MLTIAAVCVPPKYDQTHLHRLYNQVLAHTRQTFIWQPILASDKPGWWAKIDLFTPGRFDGRVLYLDLDVTITGSLDDLADYPAPFVAIKDWWRAGLNSSVMAWDAGVADHIHQGFSPETMEWFPGDQDYITTKMRGCATFPPSWVPSYKHNKRGLLPGVAPTYPVDMRVCVFHGSPRPWEVTDGPDDVLRG